MYECFSFLVASFVLCVFVEEGRTCYCCVPFCFLFTFVSEIKEMCRTTPFLLLVFLATDEIGSFFLLPHLVPLLFVVRKEGNFYCDSRLEVSFSLLLC